MKAADFLWLNAKILSAYNDTVSKTCQEYKLNKTCFNVLIFLKNNPHENTARSIVEKRGIKKAMVSVAIEQLVNLGYLKRYSDSEDRRIQRLELSEQSDKITSLGLSMQHIFQKKLFGEMSDEQRTEYLKTSEMLLTALQKMESAE